MKKFISIFLIIMLIFGIAGCKKDNTVSTNGPRPEGPKRGPVGTWDIPIPEINPLGSQDLYATTSYESGWHKLKYIENFAEYEKEIDGEVWTLEVEDKSGIPLTFLREYVEKPGIKFFANQYGDRLTFNFKNDEESLWWGDAEQTDKGYLLKIVKEKHVPVGKEITFSPKALREEAESISFMTSNEGKKFQSAIIKIPDGILNLEITSEYFTGVITRWVSYQRELPSYKTQTFILDDLPQGKDVLKWTFTWESDTIPSQFSFFLEELGEIPEIKLGDELGALKVCGAPFGQITVEAPQKVSIDHADGYSLKGDLTPEGDILFWLPAGFWNVISLAEGVGLEDSKVRLVPVNAGETTVLTLPDSLKSAYGNLNLVFAEPDQYTGGIEFTKAKDLGSTASISMLVNDPQKRDIFPTKENTTIIEGGQQVKITDITRQIAPPSVVLVLDSSGSMGKQMKATLDAAREFIKGLPDKTFIKVVDFDSEIRVLKGDTKEDVLKSISSITSGGSTKLFDATLQGLRLLEERIRPAVVLFADGADSSLDGQGEGSYSSQEEVLEAIKEANIPLFTIGFGDKPDEKALREFSLASHGEYYSAKDEKALMNVFAAIGSKFGNAFVMTYERPKEAGLSDIPVVSIIMDASGSMDTDPLEDEGCDYRMDKTKALFHDFILKLPKEALMQITSFQTNVLGGPIIRQQQITTTDKMKMLQGLGELDPGGGTPIIDAIRIGYENLSAVPSNKKVIVYLTDAALEVDEEQQPEFEALLGEIKKDNITVLWAGMGVEDKKEVFQKAADLSDGRYVISEDAAVLQSALAEILTLINQDKPGGRIPLSVTINDKKDSGDILSYAANTAVEFSKPQKSGKVIEPGVVKVVTGTPLKRYDKDVATLVTGTSVPSVDTILSKRIPFTAKESNKAMELAVKEAFYFSKFKGLEPPPEKQFLALELELKNTTPEKIQYQIPSINNHFYVNINNEGSYPASNATWLTELPLSPPGNPEVNVFPKEDHRGMLVFIVPNEPVTQSSLHFYDIIYGHINLPLMGKMDKKLLELEKLPTDEPVKISDAFSMTIKGSSVVDKVDIYKAEDNTSFCVVEADFTTKVQALLDIEPKERLWLRANTNQGPLMTQMSDVTGTMPFGFLSPVMLAPQAANKVRFVYPIATPLSKTKAEIWGDLISGSLEVPLVKGSPYGKENKQIASSSIEGLEVRVNELTTLDETVPGYNEYWVVADLTFKDSKDGFGTSIPQDCFQLVRKDYEKNYQDKAVATNNVGLGNFASGGESEGILEPTYATKNLLYGIDEGWPVFDGGERRGLLLFLLPDGGYSWTLKSPYFSDLNVPLGKGAYQSPELVVNKTEIKLFDQDFEVQLSSLIQEEILKYNSSKGASGNSGYRSTMGLEAVTDNKNNIPMPSIVTSGVEKLKAINTLADFTKAMESLKWVPSSGDYSWEYGYSPEAVLTQSWGTQWDLGNLAMGLLAKSGYTPKQRTIAPTENGRTKLMEFGKVDELPKNLVLPGISYVDEKGLEKLFVIPFMKNIEELEGLVYLPSMQDAKNYTPKSATITISAKVESQNNSAEAIAGDIADILGGGESDGKNIDYLELFRKEILLPELSLDAIEVAYPEAGVGKGKRYMVAISTPKGLEGGSAAVDSGQNKILGIQIDVELPNGTFTHASTLSEGETPDKLYHTLAINLPDLPEASAKVLESATDKEYKAAQDPDSLSALKWYSRNILNRFIMAQTTFDQKIGEDLQLTLGRTDKERCLVLTSRMNTKDSKMHTSMDLLQATNEYHNGNKETQSAYNIGAGLFVSSLEGNALTGKDKSNYIDLWAKAPKGTTLLVIPSDKSGEMGSILAADMEKAGKYPERLLRSVTGGQKFILTPDQPTDSEGQKRWAWLEIDPETYETISVFDTGEHSAYTEFILVREGQSLGEEAGKFMVGAFLGADVSVWAVASSALKLADYDEILKEAEALASSIGEYVDWVMKGIDAAAKKEISYSSDKVKGPLNMNFKLSVSDGFESRIGQNILGFKQGYDAGVGMYFYSAKKAKTK